MNRGSVPDRDPSFLRTVRIGSVGQAIAGSFPGSKAKGVQLAPHFLLAPRLRINGAIQPLSHTPLRRAHGQLYRYLYDREGYQRMLRVYILLPLQLQIISVQKQLQSKYQNLLDLSSPYWIPTMQNQ